MKFRRIIFGWLLFQCVIFAQYSEECIISSDPNDYIDDPHVVQNGLFECGDPNNLTPYGTVYDFEPPLYWERTPIPDTLPDCYASLHSSLEPENARWQIPAPFEGDTFVMLSTGGFGDINENSVRVATISQKIYLNEGDTIIGAYFFGTIDWRPYNDYADIYLELAADPNDFPHSEELFLIPGTMCDVYTVGSYESTLGLSPLTNGWIPFSYTAEPNIVGPYYLRCEVVDKTDCRINSYYAVDGLRICRGGKPLSDLNDDCTVNLIDYSILSEAWLSFCPDPPFYDPNLYDPNDWPPPNTDPNIPCQLADIDNSWFVDPNDLNIMSYEWLDGTDPNN